MMIKQEVDDDLFQPSLTDAHDATAFHEPWSPTALTYITFFLGFPGAGFFFALNWRRLGAPERFIPTLMATILVTVLLVAPMGALKGLGYFDVPGWERTARLIVRFLGLGIAFWFAHQQRDRYRMFGWSGGPKGSIWIAIVGSLVISLVSTIAVFLLAMTVARVISGGALHE